MTCHLTGASPADTAPADTAAAPTTTVTACWTRRAAARLTGGLLCAALTLTACLPEPSTGTTPEGPPTSGDSQTGTAPAGGAVVDRVIDGDTLVLTDGTRVRLLGIDAPETPKPDQPGECGADEATAALAALAGPGSTVRLELDVETIDRYGRTLAWVWAGDTLVNEALTAGGHTDTLVIAPNGRHADRIRAAQAAAQVAGAGKWGTCPR